MKHLGDITKIHGYEAPIVDVVIGGSPCQDLSVAGKRAGLAGERSGLFMEQLRIIKEMREHDIRNGRSVQYIRPRYMVWENVPGAFSSNKGEDFRAVLEETARVADKDAVIPMPPNGKWTTAGCIMGEGWSIAWRVLDAQFWGVPQRRRRIALVADFGGYTAPEILFERKGLHGDSDESGAQRERASADAEGCAPAISFQERAGKPGGGKGILIQSDHVGALATQQRQCVCIEGNGTRESHKGDGYKKSDVMYTLNTVETHGVCYGISSYESHAFSGCFWDGTQIAGTLTANNANGAQRMPDKDNFNCVVQGFDVYNMQDTGNVSKTLTAIKSDADHVLCVVYPTVGEGVCGTLDAHYANTPGVRGGMERTIVAQYWDGVMQDIVLDDQGGQQISVRTDGVSPTLRAETHENVPCVVIKDDIRT